VRALADKTELPRERVLRWAGLSRAKFAEWIKRYGKANEHNALVPRDHWVTAVERAAIVAFHAGHALDGYRRLTFMMLDQDVVAVSPTTTWRVLSAAGLLDRWNRKPTKKGTGFVQRKPTAKHVVAAFSVAPHLRARAGLTARRRHRSQRSRPWTASGPTPTA